MQINHPSLNLHDSIPEDADAHDTEIKLKTAVVHLFAVDSWYSILN